MILTDTDISKILETERNLPNRNSLVIHPFEERCLTPVGYDLRVGEQYQLLHEGVVHTITEDESVKIPPGETVSIRSLEWIAFPKNGKMAGIICSRVMLVSKGATHVSTTVDPDWVGNLLISFTNNSKTDLEIPFGERICTIVFLATKSRSKKLSQHPPGRPDALNQNASRIAKIYKIEKRQKYIIQYVAWVSLGLVYSGIVYWTHLNYGTNSLFIAMMAAGVILFGFGMEAIRYFIKDN